MLMSRHPGRMGEQSRGIEVHAPRKDTTSPYPMPMVVGLASNVKGGPNPPFDISDFQTMYPQFFTGDDDTESPDEPDEPDTPGATAEPMTTSGVTTDDITETLPPPIIPLVMLQAYVDLAHACVKHSRFKEVWKICMGLFIAHFVTLYMDTMVDPLGDAATVASAGQTTGIMASKSVDGVSVSYDNSQVLNDLEGWAGWKATQYGVQLATWAKMFSMGGMYVR